MSRGQLARALHAASCSLALFSLALPVIGAAQEGGFAPPDAEPGIGENGPPRPDVPGIAPGQPRKLTGMWEIERFIFLIPDAPMLPATKALYDKQLAAMNSGQILYTAWTSCRPGAPSAMVMPMNSLAVIEGDRDITLSFEEPRMTRRIRLNAQHPADLAPSYMGDSVGHWEGDTLVIDTIGFNGQFQLDSFGLLTSPQLHTVERLTKSADGKKVTIQTTFEDPEYYSAPFTIERAWIPHADRHQFEYDCSENPREEEFAHTYFVQDLYRPTCVRYEGKGLDPSRVLCRRREQGADEHEH
ncbi:MAG: hypothetical protein BGO08_03905 [Altererythrobacter sp. 66-12]|nr:MAG: hypothetical protein BGO08_03905 [Altererythrobacter sp. 66-12]